MMEDLFGNTNDGTINWAPHVTHNYTDEEIQRIIEEEERKSAEKGSKARAGKSRLRPDIKQKSSRVRKKEWEEFGDPRCYEGHFVPKLNLESFLQSQASWSQKRLADEVGTDAGTVSKWLSGKKYLSDKKLIQVARATGLSIPYLLDMTHKYTDVETLVEEVGYSGEDKDYLTRLGDPYAPHEIAGFANDAFQLRDELIAYTSPGEGLALYQKVVEIESSEWYDEENLDIGELVDYFDMEPWVVYHIRGDARDPAHLESELHDYLAGLPDEYFEDGDFTYVNPVRLEVYESLATILQNSANMNRA